MMSPELSPVHKYGPGSPCPISLFDYKLRMMIQNMCHHHLSNFLAFEASLAIWMGVGTKVVIQEIM